MSKRYFPAERDKNGNVIPKIGEAQINGYTNRWEWRRAKKEQATKHKKTGSTFSFGTMRTIPLPPANVIQRRKLKGWQKKAA